MRSVEELLYIDNSICKKETFYSLIYDDLVMME